METLLAERSTALPGLMTVTLNRPEKLALTKSACNALAQLMVPEQVTCNDRDLLLLAGCTRERRVTR
jgi:hypothetical protein